MNDPFRGMGKPSKESLQIVKFPTGGLIAEKVRQRGDERMETSKPLLPIIIKAVTKKASDSFRRLLDDTKKGVTITRNTSLWHVFSSYPNYQLKYAMIEIAEHYGIDLPDGEEMNKLIQKLCKSLRSVGDLHDWFDAKLAEQREGVQDQVPVQTEKSKAATA